MAHNYVIKACYTEQAKDGQPMASGQDLACKGVGLQAPAHGSHEDLNTMKVANS